MNFLQGSLTMYRLFARKGFLRSRDGASAVEFAFIAPVLLLIVAGVVDIGGALRIKFNLNSALSAASNFAMMNGDAVNSDDAADLAAKIAAIVGSAMAREDGSIKIIVNEGETVSYVAGETETSKASGKADQCYCPTRSGHDVTFGSPVTCGAVCPSGTTAGKFVVIRASLPYNPLFGGFGVVEEGNVAAFAVVRPQ